MSDGLFVIGKPAKRVDATEKVLGTAKYLGDFQVPDMLYGKVLRSPHPHSRIINLDISETLKVPGIRAVITCNDFANKGRWGRFLNDQFVLAYEKVRYVGDAIAAVAADTPEDALSGIQAIRCELEPLPVLTDMERALDPDAPQIGPDRTNGDHHNLVVDNIVSKGDPLKDIKKCPITLDRRYHTPHQDHAYLETEGALAIPSPDGSLIIYSTDQSPFINLSILVQVLGLPENKLRVIQPVIGGSFGGKNDLSYQTSAQVAALALKTGRPVRMTFSREESAQASYMRDAMNMYVKLGAEKDGTLRACDFVGIMDSGAYASGSYLTTWRAAVHAMGAYRYDSCHVDIKSVYTNNGYSGAFRGFGNPEVCFAIEQAIDELADKVGMDPIDFRLKNCLRVGDVTPHGQKLTESVGLIKCLAKVREASNWDWKRRYYPTQNHSSDIHKGIGVSIVFHGVSLGAEGVDNATATIQVNKDYSIDISTGLTDYGQGSRTVYTLITAEALGLCPDRISVFRPDTTSSFHSGPTVASRATVVGGNAALQAARNLAHLLDIAAADLFKCNPSDLLRIGEAYVGRDEEEVSWEKVVDHARSMGLVLSIRSRWDAPEIDWNFEKGQGMPYYAYHFGAQVAEVEVDICTGKTTVNSVWAAHDTGKIIFPQGAHGQIYGGIAQGMGYALMEDVVYQDGYLQNLNFNDYVVPTSMDIPEIHTVFVETDDSIGPYGAKNLAEPAMVPTAPAILNAIAHATGCRIYDLPADLERVLLGRSLQKPADHTTEKLKTGNIVLKTQ
jgi:CO/xanthine dehydrogenase Mo-binding subunit